METLRKIGSAVATGVRAVGKWIGNSLKWSWGFIELSGKAAITLPQMCWASVKAGWKAKRQIRSIFAAIFFVPACVFLVGAVLSLAALTLVVCLGFVPALIVAIALLLGPTLGLLLVGIFFVVIALITLGETALEETLNDAEIYADTVANKVEGIFQW